MRKFKTLLLFLLLHYISLVFGGSNEREKCQRVCNVQESGSKTRQRCKFPFKFKGKTFRSCTKFEDPDEKLWCSTKVDDDGKHIGKKGFWGHCEKGRYCKYGHVISKIQDYLDDGLKIKDYCTKDEFKTNDIEKYRGREECACKPIAKCEWTSRLQKLSDKLPSKAPLRKRIVQLMRDSICDYKTKTVHCCKEDGKAVDELEDTSEDYVDDAPRRTLLRQEDAGNWIPNAEKGECGQDLLFQFIVCDDKDGCAAKRNEFPYMALLGYDVLNNGKIFYTCGASVINKKYVLTAAHCHNDEKYVERIKEVIVGEYVVGEDPDCEHGSCSPPIQTFGVERVISHEKWDNGKNGFLKGNDIALVRLDGSIKLFTDDNLGSAVVPVCLPWKTNEPKLSNIEDSSDLTITGWGRVTNNNYKSKRAYLELSVATRTLRKVELPIASPGTKVFDNCRSSNNATQFCAGGIKGFDSCSGDSGGPATYRETQDSPWYQLGIVSYGSSKCGRKDRPGVYTKIEAYLPWISSHLEP